MHFKDLKKYLILNIFQTFNAKKLMFLFVFIKLFAINKLNFQ